MDKYIQTGGKSVNKCKFKSQLWIIVIMKFEND